MFVPGKRFIFSSLFVSGVSDKEKKSFSTLTPLPNVINILQEFLMVVTKRARKLARVQGYMYKEKT